MFATAPRLTVVGGLCVAVFCLITACSTSIPPKQETAKKALSSTDEQIFLGDSMKKNYDPNVFMKRGEAFFEKEEYTEAIVEYNHFLDLHRAHMLASYAQFRIGESQMKLAKGIHRIGATWYAVSKGMGFTGLPVRLFCPAEVVEIKLVAQAFQPASP